MNRSLIHRLGRLLSGVVLVASGSYVFIYLVRWEWNRALMAGLFFLAAELVLIADVLQARVARLGRQIEEDRARDQTTALAARLRANRPDAPGPFAWLAPDRDRLNVLLPVLIGAGVVLSAVAYLVEQMSRVTAVPVAEHELARGLSTMALPLEGLSPLGRLPEGPGHPVTAPRAGWGWRWITAGGLVAVLAAGILAGIQVLLSRPEPPDPGRAVTVDMVVMRRNLEQPDLDVALALWSVCPVRIPRGGAAGLPGARGPLRPGAAATDHEPGAGGVGHQGVPRVPAGCGHRTGSRRRPGGLVRRVLTGGAASPAAPVPTR